MDILDTVAENYRGRRVLVAGGTGTIGRPLIACLQRLGAHTTVAALDAPERVATVLGPNVQYHQADLTKLDACLTVTSDQEFVFNLIGIKGSVGIGQSKVASYLVPMLWFQTNLMEAAFRNCVKRYTFVSSICAYPQATEAKVEDSVWDGMPKQNDRIPGIAKRIGEIQGEAYMLEHGWDAVRILRPANVYGPYDDFDPHTAQVIPAMIARMVRGENPMTIWGDGTAVRDFIFSEDVANWLLIAAIKAPPCVPINLGSGVRRTIREVAESIAATLPNPPLIRWDPSAPTGDPVRLLDMSRARELLGFHELTDFATGIRRTVEWYKANNINFTQSS